MHGILVLPRAVRKRLISKTYDQLVLTVLAIKLERHAATDSEHSWRFLPAIRTPVSFWSIHSVVLILYIFPCVYSTSSSWNTKQRTSILSRHSSFSVPGIVKDVCGTRFALCSNFFALCTPARLSKHLMRSASSGF